MTRSRAATKQMLHGSESISGILEEMASQLRGLLPRDEPVAVVGIRTRGVPLAYRLRALLDPAHPERIPFGKLDITLYRDDLSSLGPQPIVGTTDLPFDVEKHTIVLVDDVIFTGRTARAGLEALIEFGRPRAIRFAVLVDRGWREYPIQPDVAGYRIQTTLNQIVEVRLGEIDGEDRIDLVTKNS